MGGLTVKQIFVHLVRGCSETSRRPKVLQSGKEPRIRGCDHVVSRPGGIE